ncbi:SDR family oxidoreductase [Microvirga sp. Mcv34]|uniref:SDR family oxidoreductase n=1 Tax=Microvirga sp. Mcv34 TaxID=2926016 RepID=UPI0021C89D6E|nr:SDR family NAD(P)-dependent oxidoreductase [Microvirga sp. Mcv34]
MELQGSVAFVTGAGSGIGRASAIKLAQEGAAVAAIGRTESELLQTVSEIERAGGRGIALVADVALENGMREAVARTVEAFGRIDIVVANAGINGVWAPIDDLRPDEWDKTIAINLRGTYLTLHYAVPHLKAAGGGSIIIMSSINGTRTFTTAGASAYAATKAAQLALAQQLALELGKHRIRVNAVCPGQIDTAIPDNTFKRNVDEARVPVVWPDGDIPITRGKPGQSEDVADVVVFLASPRSRHITGTPIWIDGGQSLLR